MPKFTPLFLGMFAFFLLALAANSSYERARATKPPAPTQVISLASNEPDPAVVIVKTGSTISFVSQDGLIHRVESAAGATIKTDSSDIQPGSSYELTFTQAGTYDFVDALHPQSRIKVAVYDPAK